MGREKKVPQVEEPPTPKMEKIERDVVRRRGSQGIQLKTLFHLPALCLLEQDSVYGHQETPKFYLVD